MTPNTEYVVESSQYPAPLGGGYAPIEDYQEKYRGAAIFWKFDREKGKIDPANSFAMELPPYMQDLADAGKLASEGWVFINSFNTEMSYGGTMEGNPPMESGASQNDMDYMHIIDLKKAEAVYKAGKTQKIAGMDVIMLDTTNEEGLLHLVGEPKSPHGVDVTPDGKELVVSGKLDTHATVYSFEKIKGLIDAKKYDGKDQLWRSDSSVRGQHSRPGRDRPRSASHAVRRQGQRLHLGLHRVDRGQVVAQGPQGHREGQGSLQRRSHRGR